MNFHLKFSIILISIGIIVDTLNSLLNYSKYYSDSGIFSYKILIEAESKKNLLLKIQSFFSPILNESGFFIFLIIRLIFSFLLIIFPSQLFFLIFFLFLIQLLFNIRNNLSLSGADQMRTIILFGLSIISINTKIFISLGIYFIIIQLYISYFFAGYNKLKSNVWREGKALIYIMNNEIFGNFIIQKFLIKKGKKINIFLCWGVILFQLLFPLFASIKELSILMIMIGVLFHFSLALIMNLNDFFWTFISTYPLLYYAFNYN